MKLIDWVLGLFKKPKEEVEPWPFPVSRLSKYFSVEPCVKPKAKRKPVVKKATTRTVVKKTATKKKAK